VDEFTRLRKALHEGYEPGDAEGYQRLARALSGSKPELDPVTNAMVQLHARAQVPSGDDKLEPGLWSVLGQSPYADKYLGAALRGKPEASSRLREAVDQTGYLRSGFSVASAAGLRPFDTAMTAQALRQRGDAGLLVEALDYAARCGFISLEHEIQQILGQDMPQGVRLEAEMALSTLGLAENRTPASGAVWPHAPNASVAGMAGLLQSVFYGDPGQPGKGGGGGIGTLLRALGAALSAGHQDAGGSVIKGTAGDESRNTWTARPVVTLACRNSRNGSAGLLPREWLGAGHLLERLAVYLESQDPAGFVVAAHRIRRAAGLLLRSLAGTIGVVHVRYLDDASLAVAQAARELGIPIAMTLTPDPHRSVCGPDGAIIPREGAALHELLNRVFIGDQLLVLSRGVVAIGKDAFSGPLSEWFPQLEDTRGSVRAGIDEGVDTEPAIAGIEPARMLTAPDLTLRLSPEWLDEPAIICVGRLNPVKGQVNLARAWAGSSLWKHYNLIFIGGDLEAPDGDERSIRDGIRAVLREELAGRLCHLPAQDNAVVRTLLAWFAERNPAAGTDLYVCPSLKEEFGLSILEAMAAGLPVCAPLKGGAGTYVRHGINGFLVDTRNTDSLRYDLEALMSNELSDRSRMQTLKAMGRKTVEDSYSLKAMAAGYARFYERMRA